MVLSYSIRCFYWFYGYIILGLYNVSQALLLWNNSDLWYCFYVLRSWGGLLSDGAFVTLLAGTGLGGGPSVAKKSSPGWPGGEAQET